MPIQLAIYIVKCLHNCEYSNDNKIDNIHSQMIYNWVYSNDYTIDHIYSQMTIQ